MPSPTRTFVENINRLHTGELDSVELLVSIADEVGMDDFNEFVLNHDRAAAEAEHKKREANFEAGTNITATVAGWERDVSEVFRFARLMYRSEHGRKVDAVKMLRRDTGAGLKEAKEIVDGWFSEFQRRDDRAAIEARQAFDSSRDAAMLGHSSASAPKTISDLIRAEINRGDVATGDA
jgi:ribosomal protein L7/L12